MKSATHVSRKGRQRFGNEENALKTRFVALAGIALLMSPAAYALPARMIASLKKMDPDTRFQQRCDLEAMNRIQKENHHMLPDEMVPYAFGQTKTKGNMLIAKGAAFRSHNVWRHVSYRCKTDGDHMNVLSFDYKIGDEVPRADWAKHYLVPQ